MAISTKPYVDKMKRFLEGGILIPLKAIYPFIRPYRKSYILLFLTIFINIGLTLVMTWYLKQIIDAAVSGNFEQFQLFLIMAILIAVVSAAMAYLTSYLKMQSMNWVKRDLKAAVFNKLLLLPTASFLKYRSGDLVSRLTSDINSSAGLVGENLISLIRLPVTSIFVLTFLIYINAKLAFITVLMLPFLILVGLGFGLRLKKNGKLLQDNAAAVKSFLYDTLSGHTVVRSFLLEKTLFDKYNTYNERSFQMMQDDAKLFSYLSGAMAIIGSLAYLFNLAIGASFVAQGLLSIGALLAFVSLIQYLIQPFTGFVRAWTNFQRSAAAFERVHEILERKQETADLPSYTPVPLQDVSIHFEDISFGYRKSKAVLTNVTFQAPAGKITALVGPSGAGKSTIFKLLLGLYKPTQGRIRIGQTPLKAFRVEQLRSSISYVPQETYLFDGSIHDNLIYGNMSASELDILRASKDANAHDFIMSLQDGYQSQIGERGVRLSGGQKQRIAIARAILKNAPILLLDEATSSLDNETEFLVQESLRRLMLDRTTLVIAHRLSTIQSADWVVVMDKGSVIAQGEHEALLKSCELYTKMYHLQFKQAIDL